MYPSYIFSNKPFSCRTLGGTVGISIGDTIFSSELTKRIARVAGYQGATGAQSSNGFTGLTSIQPVSLREQVLHAYTRSLATIYIVALPLAFVGLLSGKYQHFYTFCTRSDRLLCVVLTLREYSLKRTIERGAKGAHKDGEKHGTPEPADATSPPTPIGRASVEKSDRP